MNLESIVTKSQKKLSGKLSKLALASKTLLFGLSMLTAVAGFSQSVKPRSDFDSFISLHADDKINYIDSMNGVAWKIRQSNPSLSLTQLKTNIIYSDRIRDTTGLLIPYSRGKADAYSTMGTIYYTQGEFFSSLESYNKSLNLFKLLDDSVHIAGSYLNIGLVYDGLGKLDSTLHYYDKSLKLFTKLNNFYGLSLLNNNIAKVLKAKGDFMKAREYYVKDSILISNMLKHDSTPDLLSSFSVTLNNLGSSYESQKDLFIAANYYLESISLSKKSNDDLHLSTYLGNLARIKTKQKDFPGSLVLLNEAIELDVSLNNESGLVSRLQQLSQVYFGLGDTLKSSSFFDSSLVMARKLNSPPVLLDLYGDISSSFEYRGNFEQALFFFKKRQSLEDSIFSFSNNSQINDLRVRWDTKIKEQENKLLKQKSSLQEAQLTNQRWKYYGALGGSLLLFSFLSYFGFAYRKQKKSSKDLSRSKSEIELSNTLLNQEKTKLSLEKDITDKLNANLNSSIEYASRIQNSILPSSELINSNVYSLNFFFKDSFVFYKPKDVVSGDFYFAKELNNVVYFSAADSTGHGVPGAFMTLLSSTLIKESILSKDIYSPSKILDDVRNGIISNLKSSDIGGTSLSDGFDGVLCAYDKKKKYLSFAAANNPLYLIRNGEFKIYSPDKMPVGNYIKTDNFSCQGISIEKGDIVYLASDGFQDQFGGEYDKKYMSKKFKKLLNSFNSSITMSEIGIAIESEFNSWKGKTEQLDDVLVMGIRF